MTTMTVLIVLVIVMALMFDFVNGWNDSANAIATVIATRVLSPTAAVALATILNLAGAMVGVKVADTMSKILKTGPEHFSHPETILLVIIAGLTPCNRVPGCRTTPPQTRDSEISGAT